MNAKSLAILSTSSLLVLSSGCAGLGSNTQVVIWEELPSAELQKVCNAYGNLNYPLAGCAYQQQDKCFVYTNNKYKKGSAEQQVTVGHEIVAHCFKKHDHKGSRENINEIMKEAEHSSTGK